MSSQKTVVAELPPMTAQDCARFEAESGVWGEQRAIRRQQVRVMGICGILGGAAGAYWIGRRRGNTTFVICMTTPGFASAAAMCGNYFGMLLYPNVACNKETRMMRRVWWAKQCSKDWDMSQVAGETWKAKYPAVAMPQ